MLALTGIIQYRRLCEEARELEWQIKTMQVGLEELDALIEFLQERQKELNADQP